MLRFKLIPVNSAGLLTGIWGLFDTEPKKKSFCREFPIIIFVWDSKCSLSPAESTESRPSLFSRGGSPSINPSLLPRRREKVQLNSNQSPHNIIIAKQSNTVSLLGFTIRHSHRGTFPEKCQIQSCLILN